MSNISIIKSMGNAVKKVISPWTIQNGKWTIVKLKLYSEFMLRYLVGRYRDNDSKKISPTVLQLPITYRCNFDCVMCGMHKMIHRPGFSPLALGSILHDPLFMNIKAVGVNGGEPYMLNNIETYIDVILTSLPYLRSLFIITNGYFTKNILEKSAIILSKCHERGVEFHLSVSIDGYMEMQDIMRGKKGAFQQAAETCIQIKSAQSKYCDSLSGICTVTKINVYNLPELEVWAQKIGLHMNYNIATQHMRISNDYKYNNFSLLTDEHAKLMATEFFYTQFLKNKSEYYYGLYYFLRYGRRISMCRHKTDAVTLLPDGSLAYCATYSKEIGNAQCDSARKLFFSKENLSYRNLLHMEKCSICSHYGDMLTASGFLSDYLDEIKHSITVF